MEPSRPFAHLELELDWQKIVGELNDIVAVVDQEETILYVNRVVRGLTREEVIGTPLLSTILPEHRAPLKEAIRRVIGQGAQETLEVRAPGPEKSVAWYLLNLSPINQGGRPTAALLIGTDITRAKTEEAEALSREQEYRSLADNLPDAIARFDRQFRQVFVNRAAAALTGRPVEDFLGKTPRESGWPPEILDEAEAKIAEVFRTGRQTTFETSAPFKDGVHRTEVTLVPEFTANEEARTVLLISRDVTLRKAAEEALHGKEELMRQITENIKEVFWMTNPAKNEMLYISPAYENIWGRKVADLYAHPIGWVEAIHPEDRDRVLSAAKEKQTRGDYDETYRIIRPDGEIRWIHDRAFPIKDGSGTVYRVTGIAEDVTASRLLAEESARLTEELKTANEVLRGQKDYIEHIINTAPVIIVRIGSDGAILDVNPVITRITGYSPAELIGANWWEVFYPGEERGQVDQLFKDFSKGEVVNYEMRLTTKTGEKRWVSWNSVNSYDDKGAVKDVIGIGVDVTEVRKTQSIRTEAAELERFNRLMVGRELKMMELKKEVAELKAKLGQNPSV